MPYLERAIDPAKRFPVISGRGPHGRPFCRRCLKEVPSGRRSWCSDQCQLNAYIECYPSYARHALWKRDRGLCANCGKQDPYANGDLGSWQVHHLLPIKNGGAGSPLDKLITLCTSCHNKAHTKKKGGDPLA